MNVISDVRNLNSSFNLFEQVYVPSWRAALQHMLRRRSCQLLELAALADSWIVHSRRFAGRQMVPIGRIRGSENRAHDFDAGFRPRVRHTVERWCRVAEAWQKGAALPPVELIQVGDTYFVRDGHHRISVASAFGAREIDALVTVWVLDSACTAVELHQGFRPFASAHTM